ncbi:MAG: hypothetical protein QOH18_1278 [Solirubrobacterales bacterium]|nr:hypothetical protein [Solirubrobacterales bacterium]
MEIAPRVASAEPGLAGSETANRIQEQVWPTVTGEWEEVLSTLPPGDHGTPWLLAGDFNATFDQAPFRELVGRGYRDAGEVAGKGLDATFPADGSLLPPPITIDHILADERFGIVEYEVEPLPDSDHHAIFGRAGAARSMIFVYAWLEARCSAGSGARPSSAIDSSRILNFCTLPVTVIGKASTSLT